MRTKIRAYRKTNFVLIRKFTDYLHRFFIVSKGGAMEEFTKELLDQLNVDTAFTIGPFAISESVVITWVVMAILVLLSASQSPCLVKMPKNTVPTFQPSYYI